MFDEKLDGAAPPTLTQRDTFLASADGAPTRRLPLPVDRAGDDPAARALDDLIGVLQATQHRLDEALRRAESLRAHRATGARYRDIVRAEQRPLLVEIVSEAVLRLVEAGSRFRRAEARALRDDGLTMDAIAGLFGVTRQRISHLLRTTAPDTQRNQPVAP
jgi:hypothetical protein